MSRNVTPHNSRVAKRGPAQGGPGSPVHQGLPEFANVAFDDLCFAKAVVRSTAALVLWNALSCALFAAIAVPAVATFGSDPGVSTETVALDISKFTQFDGGFQTFSFTKNGYAQANTQSIKFDSNGDVVAGFDVNSHTAST